MPAKAGIQRNVVTCPIGDLKPIDASRNCSAQDSLDARVRGKDGRTVSSRENDASHYTFAMIGFLIYLAIVVAVLLIVLTATLAYEMRHPPRRTASYAIARGMPCDPGELMPPLKFEEWNLDRPDGAVLPVWDVQTTAANEGPGLTAVFVHGWGHSRIDALVRAEAFTSICERTVMYDLRGHGETSGGASRLGDREDDDLLALLERVGSGNVVLIGHSMGAVIAINAAIKAHRKQLPIAGSIRGIIAYGAYSDFHASLQGRLRSAGYPARPVTDLALILHRMMGVRPLSLSLRDIAELPCPLLMLHGCDDAVAHVTHARRLADACSNARLIEIAGAKHTDVHCAADFDHASTVQGFLQSFRDE